MYVAITAFAAVCAAIAVLGFLDRAAHHRRKEEAAEHATQSSNVHHVA